MATPASPAERSPAPGSSTLACELAGSHASDGHRTLAVVGEFLAGYQGRTRQTYADHLGYPYRVVATKTEPVGAHRDVARLRNGLTFLAWCAGHSLDPLHDVDRRHILVWIDDLAHARSAAGAVLAAITRGQMVSVVSAFYTWASCHGPNGAAGDPYTTRNPVVVDRGRLNLQTKTEHSPTRSLTVDEVAALQHAADHDPARGSDPIRTGAVVALLFELGVRVAELTGLNTDDMSIMQGRRVVTITGKAGKRRTLPVTGTTAARIDHHLATRQPAALAPALPDQVNAATAPLLAARGHRTGDLVPLRAADLLVKLRSLAAHAGLAHPRSITPHVARHTWATTARAAGITDSAIRTHLGHSDLRTTDRYGQHVTRIVHSPVDQVARAYAEARTAGGYTRTGEAGRVGDPDDEH